MEKKFCPYCGRPLSEGCDCEEMFEVTQEDYEAIIQDIEERQHKSGMYAQQDVIEMYRRER